MIVAVCDATTRRLRTGMHHSPHIQRSKQTRMSMYEYGGEYEELVYCGVRTTDGRASPSACRCRVPAAVYEWRAV